MIIIKKKEKESIDRMLKRYKAKAKRTKLKSQLTNRKHYTKPFKSYWTNTIVYSFLIIMVFLFNTAKTNSFIYFQF